MLLREQACSIHHPSKSIQTSFLRSLLRDGGAFSLPLRRVNKGCSDLHRLFQGSGQGCPLLRASDEHSFIVRVLRARRAPGRSLPILLMPRVARAQETV